MKKDYRSDIDGLRAIAVVSVIIYHANITLLNNQILSGGFLGVDIFFVISGYLITKIIVNDLDKNNFSFANFYERRIRRILPALFSIFIFTFLLSWIFLLPIDFINYSKSVISSFFFISNYYFYLSGLEYGAQVGLLKPILHTWSLSVEEQYYLIFPFFLFFFYKTVNKKIFLIIILLIVSSFILSHLNIHKNSELKFYSIHTRIWELLIGSLILFIEKSKKAHQFKINNSLFQYLGILLICISFFFLNDETKHPSYLTLIPLIGTALIIICNKNNSLIYKIISSKLFVGTGLISYSLYLWHFPLFAYARISELSQLGNFFKIIICILILILSVISYQFIEKPFRDKRYNFKKLSIILSFIGIVILSANWLVIKSNGFAQRYSDIYEINEIDNRLLKKKSWEIFESKRNFFDKNINNKKILFLGDSHTKGLFNSFYLNKKFYPQYDFSTIRYLLNLNLSYLLERKDFQSAKYIVLTYRLEEENFENFEKLINFLLAHNKKIIISSRKNEYLSDFKLRYKNHWLINLTLADKFFLENNLKFITSDNEIQNLNKIYYFNKVNVENIQNINKKLKDLTLKYNLLFFNQNEYQCEDNKDFCHGITPSGKKIFYDYGHYTIDGSKFFGEQIYEKNLFNFE